MITKYEIWDKYLSILIKKFHKSESNENKVDLLILISQFIFSDRWWLYSNNKFTKLYVSTINKIVEFLKHKYPTDEKKTVLKNILKREYSFAHSNDHHNKFVYEQICLVRTVFSQFLNIEIKRHLPSSLSNIVISYIL